jgi:hypothetical protein
MCANSTGCELAFLSASDAAVSQEVADGKITIQSACALNTRYNYNVHDFRNDISDYYTSYAHVLKLYNNHYMQVEAK